MRDHRRRRATPQEGRNTPAPFGLRAARAPLRRCWRSTMTPHRLRTSALHRHPWCPQRDPVYFHHGLLEQLPAQLSHRAAQQRMRTRQRA